MMDLFWLYISRACEKFLSDYFLFLLILYMSRKSAKKTQFASSFKFSQVYQRFIWKWTHNGFSVQSLLKKDAEPVPKVDIFFLLTIYQYISKTTADEKTERYLTRNILYVLPNSQS